MLPRLKLKNCLSIILGSAILAFGLYNIHSISGVTEGGVLGLTLLLEHWFGISPSISGLVLNGACYALGLTNFDLFNRVVKYVVENVGKTFSANAIVKFMKGEGRSLSVEAVYNYLEWLEKAFVIYRCQRYDMQGKTVLKTQEKFYLADASLKYCMMGFNPKSVAAMLENIVYFELR